MSATVSDSDPYVETREQLLSMAKSDKQLGELIPSDAVTKSLVEPGISNAEIISRIFDGYGDRPSLGTRSYEIYIDEQTQQCRRRYSQTFTTITYGELRHRVEALANCWREDPRYNLASDEFIIIFGSTSLDFAVVDIACTYAHLVSVPLQAIAGLKELRKVFGDVSPSAIVTGIEDLPLVVKLAVEFASVRTVIVRDADLRVDDEKIVFEGAKAALSSHEHRVTLAAIDDLIASGERLIFSPLSNHPLGEERLSMLLYTSGSTGTPKGAMLPERTCRNQWIGGLDGATLAPTISLNYAPLNHLIGRYALFGTMAAGGTSYFILRDDMSTLLEDIQIVRPTAFSFIPRVADLIYQHYQSEVLRLSTKTSDRNIVASGVRREMRSTFLGDRLRRATISGAPTAPNVKDFLRDCFSLAFREGFATTEGGGALVLNNQIVRKVVTDYKLRDVPELGYLTSDKPYPRGELLYKSTMTIPGYYKNPETSAALYDDEGFQVTGDIVEERAPDHIVWIDRRNNVLKLSQGEFVAIGALEATFDSGTPEVRQIFLHGDPYRSYILAVVVPDINVVVRQLGHVPDGDELRSALRSALHRTGRSAGLKSFEIPRDVIVEMEPFSFENGLLSSVRKPLRPKLKARYGAALDATYDKIESKRHNDVAALREADTATSLSDRIFSVLTAALGSEEKDKSKTFKDLGGDSLGAISLSLLLEDIFSVSVPVSLILSPGGSAERIARFIETADDEAVSSGSMTFDVIHGKCENVVQAKDLAVEVFLGEEASMRPAKGTGVRTRTVLVTGATGYLGRFLCLEWLERMVSVGGKVICLVRAADVESARRRLEEAIGNHDPSLIKYFRDMAGGSLEVLPADLEERNFGMREAEYLRLAEDVDHVVHCAALVNHVFSYKNLFRPNVVSTAECIKFSLTKKLKKIDYISTMAVAAMFENRSREGGDIRVLLPSIRLSDRYASGYATSKWAGEVLLRDAHDRFGLPVTVFRADMILAHSRFRGQINLADVFTRLIYSIIVSGLAPKSFYESEEREIIKAHYEGLPVDFVADAIFSIGAREDDGFHTHNVWNSHDSDGISLDTIVDWIESAGFQIERVQEYSDWLTRFELALQLLSDEERAKSALPILSSIARPYRPRRSSAENAQFELNAYYNTQLEKMPHISERFIHKCISDLRHHGLIGS